MQEELQDRHAAVGQQLLEIVDVPVTTSPDGRRHEPPDPHRQDIFVVGTVEDADAAERRDLAVYAPQEVVRQLLGCRSPEACDAAALRVEPRSDVADRAVLA